LSGHSRYESQYLGSLGPHHTPIPPTALGVPFALHAPSEYTISTVVFLGGAILGTCAGGPSAGVVTVLDMDWGGGFEVNTRDGLGVVTMAGFEMNPTDGFDGV